jgi:LDH2 family malate/lactate/ureidoglycolate dehydrogenase
MGSHKGYGLAAMVEILSAVLSGTRRHDRDPAPDAQRVGHLCMALDPQRFRDAGAFETDMDVLIDDLRATPPIDAAEPVLVAGDPEYAAAERVLHEGSVRMSRMLFEDLREICSSCGVPFRLDNTTPREVAR